MDELLLLPEGNAHFIGCRQHPVESLVVAVKFFRQNLDTDFFFKLLGFRSEIDPHIINQFYGRIHDVGLINHGRTADRNAAFDNDAFPGAGEEHVSLKQPDAERKPQKLFVIIAFFHHEHFLTGFGQFPGCRSAPRSRTDDYIFITAPLFFHLFYPPGLLYFRFIISPCRLNQIFIGCLFVSQLLQKSLNPCFYLSDAPAVEFPLQGQERQASFF